MKKIIITCGICCQLAWLQTLGNNTSTGRFNIYTNENFAKIALNLLPNRCFRCVQMLMYITIFIDAYASLFPVYYTVSFLNVLADSEKNTVTGQDTGLEEPISGTPHKIKLY